MGPLTEMNLVQYLANLVSTVTILSSLFLKVPQISSIKKKKSAQGIYVQATLLEIIAYTTTALYNYTNSYSIMTYLEYPIILVQLYALLYYILMYKGLLELPSVPFGAFVYSALTLTFAMEMLPKTILSYVVPLCTPISGFAKVTYIYGIIQAQNADAVSRTTWIISVTTNLARVFTVYVDSADFNLLFNFTVSAMLSFGVFATAVFYQNKSIEVSKAKAQ